MGLEYLKNSDFRPATHLLSFERQLSFRADQPRGEYSGRVDRFLVYTIKVRKRAGNRKAWEQHSLAHCCVKFNQLEPIAKLFY